MSIPKVIYYKGHVIHLAEPSQLPRTNFVPIRSAEHAIKMARVAWDIRLGQGDSWSIPDAGSREVPLNFRLEGRPGVGKNEIVYSIARRLKLPYFSIVGHEEMTPEDLILSVVPRESRTASEDGFTMVLRASPLATALLTGGIFFFDELNRAPMRTLSPLSPLLDDRRQLFSTIIETWLGHSDCLQELVEDEQGGFEEGEIFTTSPFLFCCALNPEAGMDLPEYIDQRTLPRIQVKNPTLDEMVHIVGGNFAGCDALPDFIDEFRGWWSEDRVVSVRQVLVLFQLADRIAKAELPPGRKTEAFREAAALVFHQDRPTDP
jgi:hypothetical protein